VVIDIFVLVKEFCELLLLLHLFQKSFANYGQFYQRFLQRCFFLSAAAGRKWTMTENSI